MDAINIILAGIAAAASGLIPILYVLAVAALLDLGTGLWAAYRSGTLDGKYIPAWISSSGDKIAKILVGLIAGVAVGGTDSAAGLALIALGGAAAAAYLAGVVSSIAGNLSDGAARTKGAPTSGGTLAGITILNAPSNDPIDESDAPVDPRFPA